ncbi:MAG: hypothetical protein LKG43_05520 [Lachnospiraceae bacterium]|nr:hypothetical protein [Lachnospiraceae bacterium]
MAVEWSEMLRLGRGVIGNKKSSFSDDTMVRPGVRCHRKNRKSKFR